MSRGFRICGTPGCNLRDFHDGPCQGEEPPSKRPRLPLPPPPPRRLCPPPAPPKQPRKPKFVEAAPEEPPPEQRKMPNGLYRFYYTHRYGVPLPMGTLVEGADSDEELDESWRLDETEQRIRSRGVATPAEAEFMVLWNAHVHCAPPLVSDHGVSSLCRTFAKAHAATLSAALRVPLLAHLRTLSAHNLVRREDVVDILVIVEADGSPQGGAARGRGSGRKSAGKRAASGSGTPASSERRITLCEQCARPQHRPGCPAF